MAEESPYRPGYFYRRELPPLHAVLVGLGGTRLPIVSGYADQDSGARPAWVRMLRVSATETTNRKAV